MTVAIGEIVKNGILFDLKNWRQKMTNINDFNQVVEELFDTLTLRQIDYLLVGGVALLSYVQSRNTQDIDLILSKSALESLSYSIDIEETFKILSNHLLPTDLEQIKEIANDIESRVKRFASQKKKLEEGQ